jgi:hypothetical protein
MLTLGLIPKSKMKFIAIIALLMGFSLFAGPISRQHKANNHTIITSSDEATGNLIQIEVTHILRNSGGELIWMEFYNYAPKKGVIINSEEVIRIITKFLSTRSVESEKLSPKLRLIRHEVVWENLIPSVHTPTHLSPDGI